MRARSSVVSHTAAAAAAAAATAVVVAYKVRADMLQLRETVYVTYIRNWYLCERSTFA